MKHKQKVLILAGSDSSGGAGIQADIKTITSLGSYAMTAITAITVQNTTGVSSIVPIHPKAIAKQILFTCKDNFVYSERSNIFRISRVSATFFFLFNI